MGGCGVCASTSVPAGGFEYIQAFSAFLKSPVLAWGLTEAGFQLSVGASSNFVPVYPSLEFGHNLAHLVPVWSQSGHSFVPV